MKSLLLLACVAALCILGISSVEAKSVGKGVLRGLLEKLQGMSKVDTVKSVAKRYHEYGPSGASGARRDPMSGQPREVVFLMMIQPCLVLETGNGVQAFDILAMKLDCILKIIGGKIGSRGRGPGGRGPGGMGPGGMGPDGMGPGGIGPGGMGPGKIPDMGQCGDDGMPDEMQQK